MFPVDDSLVFESDYYIADGAAATGAGARHRCDGGLCEFGQHCSWSAEVPVCARQRVLPRLFARELRQLRCGRPIRAGFDGDRANVSKLADNAMELLLSRIGEGADRAFEDRVLAPRLVCQASVAPIAN